MVNPFLIGDFIDSLIYDGTMSVVFRFSIIFASLNIIRTALSYVTMIIYTKTQARAAHEFSQDAINHVQNLSLSFINKKDTDYLSQVINGDTNMLIIFCINVVQSFILNTIYLIAPLVILFYLNAQVTIVFLVFLTAYIFIYVKFKSPLFKRGMALRVIQNTYFAKLLEQLKFTKFIKTHVLGGIFRSRMDRNFNKLLEKNLGMQRLSFAYSSLDTAVTTVAQVSLFLLGGYLILNGSFTIGMFTIFSMYFSMLIGAAKHFFDFGKTYQDNLISYERLNEIFETAVETQGNMELESIEKIKVKGLKFSYNGSEARNIIGGLDLNFAKNNIYGIIGRNGAGKSTLVNLLIGFYMNEKEGEVYFNDIASKNLNMIKLREERIGVCEQEPVILNESICYNVTLGTSGEKSIEISKIQNILKALDLNNFNNIRSYNKHEPILGFVDEDIPNDEPLNLSGGEKQRLAILRLLIKNPDVMFFDEPTAALDSHIAKGFMEYLCRIKSNKIIIIITHDEFVKKYCDEIIEIR